MLTLTLTQEQVDWLHADTAGAISEFGSVVDMLATRPQQLLASGHKPTIDRAARIINEFDVAHQLHTMVCTCHEKMTPELQERQKIARLKVQKSIGEARRAVEQALQKLSQTPEEKLNDTLGVLGGPQEPPFSSPDAA